MNSWTSDPLFGQLSVRQTGQLFALLSGPPFGLQSVQLSVLLFDLLSGLQSDQPSDPLSGLQSDQPSDPLFVRLFDRLFGQLSVRQIVPPQSS
jgi:hypothetical protein